MKILAAIKKEMLVMLRDKGGMALLFLMPSVLITVMALVQDAPFRDYQEFVFDLLFVDDDHGKLSSRLKKGLEESKQFILIDSADQKPLDLATAKSKIQNGEFKLAIHIPKGATAEIVNSSNQVINAIGDKIGIYQKLSERDSRDSIKISLYFDPAAKKSFRVAILQAINRLVTKEQTVMVFDRISRQVNARIDSSAEKIDIGKKLNGLQLEEKNIGDKSDYDFNTNSVQHNVPAWTIFGIFFIVVPIAGNIIREKDEGSFNRVLLIPGAYWPATFGKVIFYQLFGMLQFFTMITLGILLMPLLGLPSLVMGDSLIALVLLAFSISSCATTMGLLAGTVFKTTNQALPFASISVVLLSAIGGIWVPIEILPDSMKNLAKASPLHWALDGINQLFLRGGNLIDILPNLFVLLGISMIFVTVVLLWEKRNYFR